ncbi:MAG TPA: NAD(P)/FAD-dependent oxidoreductase [Candidatus Dormibacteraeota bacterium]|nr:NAD(P)/FAD-dependent oxidoreductase [Candidatus Dormibacteraeota bacterium]
MQRLDVAVLGGGVAGLTAAYLLRDRDLEVFDSASHVGGRTRSLQQADGIWLNTGAQYVSTDRIKVVELADAVGARLITDDNLEEYWRGLYPPDPDERSEIESVIERITEQQMHRRPATLPELDDQPFDQWLGDVSPATHRFFDRWCQIMNSGSSVEISLYGALWLWGDQRSTPWIDRPVPRHDRGDCVFDGGTNEFTKALARAAGGRVSLRSCVRSVRASDGGYTVDVEDERGGRQVWARQVVSAVPAPVAAEVIDGLPGWKRRALDALRYGRFMTINVVVSPKDARPTHHPLTASRSDVVYNLDAFVIKTPGDFDERGGCFHNIVGDPTCRVVWDDPDHTIKTGVLRELFRQKPQYRERVVRVEVQRWPHGMPLYSVGRMKTYDQLAEPVGGVFFCGDYSWASNMEGAALSGERAAVQMQRTTA